MCTLSQPAGWTAKMGVDLDGQKAARTAAEPAWVGLSPALAPAAVPAPGDPWAGSSRLPY